MIKTVKDALIDLHKMADPEYTIGTFMQDKIAVRVASKLLTDVHENILDRVLESSVEEFLR